MCLLCRRLRAVAHRTATGQSRSSPQSARLVLVWARSLHRPLFVGYRCAWSTSWAIAIPEMGFPSIAHALMSESDPERHGCHGMPAFHCLQVVEHAVCIDKATAGLWFWSASPSRCLATPDTALLRLLGSPAGPPEPLRAGCKLQPADASCPQTWFVPAPPPDSGGRESDTLQRFSAWEWMAPFDFGPSCLYVHFKAPAYTSQFVEPFVGPPISSISPLLNSTTPPPLPALQPRYMQPVIRRWCW